MIELINYQETIIEISYLVLKKNYLTEEIKLISNEKTTNEELIQFKKRHLNIMVEWVNELKDTDSQLLKFYYLDEMKLENISSLLSINHGVAAHNHSYIMRKLNHRATLNRFPYQETLLYKEYLSNKDKEKEKEKKENRRDYYRKYRLKRKNKN